jgi:hypothetical protein
MVTGVNQNGALEAIQSANIAEGKQACKPGSVMRCQPSRSVSTPPPTPQLVPEPHDVRPGCSLVFLRHAEEFVSNR